ncbi:MAG: hypothetical protein H0W50_03675 [Parachlamydiaceae bacterium]|nr:hypothetical protein [Parachlamydiaceae bacterium]
MIINNSILPMDLFEQEIFVKFENFDLNNMRINQKKEQIHAQISEVKNNLQSINNIIKLHVHKFEMKKVSWVRLFVNILNLEIFVLLKIKHLFCLIFPSINLEFKKQIYILKSIKLLQGVKNIIELELSILSDFKDWFDRKNDYLKKDHFELQKNYRALKKYLIPNDLMKDLFGGRKAFENLPLGSMIVIIKK